MIALVTSHCALGRKDSLHPLALGSALAERVGQGKVCGVAHRVLCTWQLLGWDVKGTWLAMCLPILALAT